MFTTYRFLIFQSVDTMEMLVLPTLEVDMRILRWNDVVELPWEDRFEPLLTQFNATFQDPGEPNILRRAARVLLLLSKEGKEPTAAEVLQRVREEDAISPVVSPAGYDEDKWFNFMVKAVDALQSDDPYRALGL
jgi:hypothetical protein